MSKNNDDDYDDFYGCTFASVVHADVFPDEIWIEFYWNEVFDVVCVCAQRKEKMLMNMTW